MNGRDILRQQLALFLSYLFVYSITRCCHCVADDAGNGDDIFLDSTCIGSPNEESGSVFSITYIITVRCAMPPAEFLLTMSRQCSISAIVPCDQGLSLRLTILGNKSGALQIHEQAVDCGHTQYSATFVVTNRLILSGR